MTLQAPDPRFLAAPRTPQKHGGSVLAVGSVFFFSSILLSWTDLHGHVIPLFGLFWFVMLIVALCRAAASWEPELRWGGLNAFGRVGGMLITISALLGGMAVFGPRHDPHDSDVRRQVRCASHLMQIGQALFLYGSEYRRYPDRIETLLTAEELTPDVLICPSTDDHPATGPTTQAVSDAIANGGHLSYVYLGKGLLPQKVKPDDILAYESRSNHLLDRLGINVLYGDGRVAFVEQPDADLLLKRIAEAQAGKFQP